MIIYKKHRSNLQCVLERPAKLPIEIRINEWVDGGVEVANPEDHTDHNLRRVAVITQRADAVPAFDTVDVD